MRHKRQNTTGIIRPELQIDPYGKYLDKLLDKMSDRLNDMTRTDVIKILIEKAIIENFHDEKIIKKRKIFQKLDY